MRTFSLCMIYYLLGLTTTFPIFAIRRDLQKYDLSLAQLTMLMYIPITPWSFKCIFGPPSDMFGFRGYHRKPYMVFTALLCAIFCFCLEAPDLLVGAFIGLFFAINFFAAWGDVIYDAINAEERKFEHKKQKGRTRYFTWIARCIGMLVGRTTGPLVWEAVGSKTVYAILGSMYLKTMIACICIKDYPQVIPVNNNVKIKQPKVVIPSVPIDEQGQAETTGQPKEMTMSSLICFQISLMKESLKHPVLNKILLFIIVTGLFPSPGLALFYFLNDQLHYTPTEMSILAGASEIGHIAGIVIFEYCLKRFKIRNIYMILQFIRVLLGIIPLFLTWPVVVPPNQTCPTTFRNNTSTNDTCYFFEQAGINPFPLSLSDDCLGEVIDEMLSMPLSHITQIVCFATVEATVVSVILATQNLVSGVRGWIDATMLVLLKIDHGHYEHLPFLLIIAIVLDFIAGLFASVLPDSTIEDVEKEVSFSRNADGSFKVSSETTDTGVGTAIAPYIRPETDSSRPTMLSSNEIREYVI